MRRIKFLMVGVMLFTITGLKAQDSTFFANEYTKGLALLRKAQEFSDIDMEKQALYDLLILNEGDTTVLQSLTQMYYNTGNFTSSLLVSLSYLKLYPGNLLAIEIAALCYEQLRLYDKAVQYYEDLYLREQSIEVLYQIAFLQYTLQRFEESLNNVKILETKADGAKNLTLSKRDNTTQEVPFRAALLNIKGLISMQQGNKEEAIVHFNEALKIAPDFEAPQTSLETINKG